MAFRSDMSYDSANNPTQDNRFTVFDQGMYIAQIVDKFYTDSTQNNTTNDNGPQVLYKLRIIGGRRDGQIFDNAVDMQLFGGITNNSERGWKKTTTLARLDPANIFNPNSEQFLNGDVVYIMFINGDIHYPVIIGGAKHASDVTEGASESDGPVFRTSFNGISTNIDEDGVLTWTKAKGEYFPFPTTNSDGQLLWDQFVALPGFDEAFKLTVDNDLSLALSINPTPGTSLSMALDASQDSISFANVTGASLTLDGISDSFEYSSKAGAALSVKGEQDEVSIETSAGTSAIFSGLTGVKLKDSVGAELNLANGLVALGNESAELLDLFNQILQQLETLTQALSTESPAGFGAPLVNVATYISVNTQITAIQTLLQTIKGSL